MFDFVSNKNVEKKDCQSIIYALEKKYSIVFPEILKQYYSLYDGEEIEYCNIRTEDDPEVVSEIVCLQNDELGEIKEDYDSDGFIPKTMFPIAGSLGGDYYFWDSETGGVYLIYGEDIDNPRKRADSVEEFFKMLDASQK